MVSTEAIRALVEPAVTSTGLELWDVEVARDVVRILVDRPGGVDLESLASLDRVISPLLDSRPELVPPGRYELEVSSPGVERTLRTLDQYRRYIGTEISVKTSTPVDGSRRRQGRLVAVEEGSITLTTDASPSDVVEIRHDVIDRARTVLVWGPTPAPKAGRKAAKQSTTPTPTSTPRPPARTTTAAVQPKDTRS